jgi:hypothetical protein
MKGKSLWNKEGMSFFSTAEKNWTRVYNDDKLKEVLCRMVKMVGKSGMDLTIIKHFIQ